MSGAETLFYSLLGGIIPALVWLWFWLREDSKKPEPLGKIAETFLFGMIAVVLVLPFQKWVAARYPGLGVTTFALWALIEESFKFLAAWFGGLGTVKHNKPLDPLIYMITASLGFVALENALFIANPFLAHDIIGGVITGSLRFVGANLLHVIASSTIGAAIALTFYKPKHIRVIAGFCGFILAIFFHTSFNLAIVNQQNLSALLVFGTVWAGVAILLWIFERVKAIPVPDIPREPMK